MRTSRSHDCRCAQHKREDRSPPIPARRDTDTCPTVPNRWQSISQASDGDTRGEPYGSETWIHKTAKKLG
ncbi:MAG: hypothetical protein MI725_01315, partial [Pirellulales bacterium]|nr:hypothetical protein [Pirellulales bacterium]